MDMTIGSYCWPRHALATSLAFGRFKVSDFFACRSHHHAQNALMQTIRVRSSRNSTCVIWRPRALQDSTRGVRIWNLILKASTRSRQFRRLRILDIGRDERRLCRSPGHVRDFSAPALTYCAAAAACPAFSTTDAAPQPQRQGNLPTHGENSSSQHGRLVPPR